MFWLNDLIGHLCVWCNFGCYLKLLLAIIRDDVSSKEAGDQARGQISLNMLTLYGGAHPNNPLSILVSLPINVEVFSTQKLLAWAVFSLPEDDVTGNSAWTGLVEWWNSGMVDWRVFTFVLTVHPIITLNLHCGVFTYLLTFLHIHNNST